MSDAVIEGIAGFLGILLSVRFLGIFMKKRETGICRQALVCVIYFAVNFGLYLYYHSPAINLLTNLAGLMLLTTLFEAKWTRKLFCVILSYGITVGADAFCVCLVGQYSPGEAPNPFTGYLVDLIEILILIILERKYIGAEHSILPLKYNVLLGIIPVLSIFSIMGMTYLNDILEKGREQAFFQALVLLLINCLVFYLNYMLQKLYSAQIEKDRMKQMVEIYKRQMQTVQESRERLKEVRHDLKHHMLELAAMIQKGEKTDTLRYLQQMEEFMISPTEFATSGN